MSNISIKSKLLAMLLGVSVVSIAVVSSLNYVTSYDALRESVFAHLTSVRASRGDQMRQGFDRMRRETMTIGAGNVIGQAAREFIQGFRALEDAELTPEQTAALRGHYEDVFLPQLARNSIGTPELATYRPGSNAARFLQYHFIAANPNPVGNKDALLGDNLPFEWAATHARHHLQLRTIARNFNYYDLLIIDIETGDVVYSIEKETDFGTNLATGPYDTSNLATIFRRIQRTPDRGAVQFIDFAFYRPSLNEPAAFFAAPIMDGARAIAVVAVQTSVDRINLIMTGSENWERDGLGKTGETILVGPDFTMRSVSRFLIEDPDGYVASLRATKMPEQDIQQIIERNSPILEQKVRTVAAEEALRGQTGSGVIIDYRGVEILGSWAPLGVPDLNWGIVGKVDLDEAYAPIADLAKNTVIYTIILLLVITLAVMFMASSFVRPVNELISRVQRVGAGDVDVSFGKDSDDEIGELSRSFRELADSLKAQTQSLDSMTAENQKLMETVMPRGLAQRMSDGGEDISEVIEEVSVIFAELQGLAELTQDDSTDAIEVLKSVIATFDESARRLDVEKIRTVGDTYMATCGLSAPIFDHARRTVEFARELQANVKRFNAGRNLQLGVMIGVSSGRVHADVSHQQGLVFHLYGETVIQADHARDVCEPGEIVVTQSVHDKLNEFYDFEVLKTSGELPLWTLKQDSAQQTDA